MRQAAHWRKQYDAAGDFNIPSNIDGAILNAHTSVFTCASNNHPTINKTRAIEWYVMISSH